MGEQVGWQGLLANIKNEAPRYAHMLPQLPRLLHQALERTGGSDDSQLLARLLEEQKATNNLLRVAMWFTGGFLASIVLMQLWSLLDY